MGTVTGDDGIDDAGIGATLEAIVGNGTGVGAGVGIGAMSGRAGGGGDGGAGGGATRGDTTQTGTVGAPVAGGAFDGGVFQLGFSRRGALAGISLGNSGGVTGDTVRAAGAVGATIGVFGSGSTGGVDTGALDTGAGTSDGTGAATGTGARGATDAEVGTIGLGLCVTMATGLAGPLRAFACTYGSRVPLLAHATRSRPHRAKELKWAPNWARI